MDLFARKSTKTNQSAGSTKLPLVKMPGKASRLIIDTTRSMRVRTVRSFDGFSKIQFPLALMRVCNVNCVFTEFAVLFI